MLVPSRNWILWEQHPVRYTIYCVVCVKMGVDKKKRVAGLQ